MRDEQKQTPQDVCGEVNFFKFCRRFWNAVFISLNLGHRLIVREVLYKESFNGDYIRLFLRYF